MNEMVSPNFFITGILLIFLITALIMLLLYRRRYQDKSSQNAEKDEMLSKKQVELETYKQTLDSLHKEEKPDNVSGTESGTDQDIILKKALKRAEEANFQKNSFISNISHEIRTPLNNIIGFSSLLEAEISLLENNELYDYAHSILESGERLLHILNNIIDISRIESHDMRIHLKPCIVNEIIGNATQLFIFKANEQKLKLNFVAGEIPDALADETALTKVITAIIENAIKYTRKGFVNISSDFLPGTSEISIRIKDSGIGIDPSYLSMIFDPFRNESLGFSKEDQGAGLGLPLAKSLIELMKGRIQIESAKEKGTVVTIFLHSAAGAQPPTVIKEIARKEKFRSLQDLEIFIVEDDLMNKLVLYEMTKSLGHVITAVNGEETLKVIERTFNEGKIFDIMLFDINLPPPWDGIVLMKEIRKKWKEYKTIPFVAQTAYAMTGDKEKLLESGFDDYISKPINQQELYSIIKNQLNKF